MTHAAFFGIPLRIDGVYSTDRKERLAEMCRLRPEIITASNINEHLADLSDLEVIFSTWGMFVPTAEQFAAMPRLKVVFYAAGSVQGFARPFLERSITVVSGWGANGIPVAEFTLAQILLATKGYFRNVRDVADPAARTRAFLGPGNYGETVALLGAGMIGRKIIELLKPFRLKVVVFDPFLPEEKAAELGVEKVTLQEAFQRGLVVSNHIANLPETRLMLKAEHFAGMRQNSVFLNTGRGETIVTEDMVDVLKSRPDITALLDVLSGVNPEANAPLFDLPNVVISGHIAGSIGDEVRRMADFMTEEFAAWRSGKPLRYSVTMDMLKTMA